MYHINPETGKTNICRAKEAVRCKFYNKETGELPPHFKTQEAAAEYYEYLRQEDVVGEPLTKSDKESSEENLVTTEDHYTPQFDTGEQKNILDAYSDYGLTLEEDYGDMDSLGVRSATVTGGCVGKQMYDAKQVSGTINYNNLDDNSYKNFGFADSDTARGHSSMETEEDFTEYEKYMNNSESASIIDVNRMSDEEQSALSYYTDDNAGWINRYLYSGTYSESEMAKDNEFNNSNEELPVMRSDGSVENVSSFEINKENHEGLVRLMDSALSKSPGLQRTVYRGFNAKKNKAPNGGDWENIPLGQELRFDAYTSTTLDPDITGRFSRQGNVFFEIKTASGVGVAEISRNSGEDEVLIPRGSRFMVVGRQKVSMKTLCGFSFDTNKDNTLIQLVEINEEGEIIDHNNIKESTEMRNKRNYR